VVFLCTKFHKNSPKGLRGVAKIKVFFKENAESRAITP
jgi:hypothetical protein